MNFGELELQAYEERLKWMRIEANTLKKHEEKARAEEKTDIARNLLASNVSVSVIAQATGLTIEEIESLKPLVSLQ
jgi:predicted transposase/invertase (TIGR01784 family)